MFNLSHLLQGHQYVAVFQREDGTHRIRCLDALRLNMMEEDRDDDDLFLKALIESLGQGWEDNPCTVTLYRAHYHRVWKSDTRCLVEEEQAHGTR